MPLLDVTHERDLVSRLVHIGFSPNLDIVDGDHHVSLRLFRTKNINSQSFDLVDFLR